MAAPNPTATFKELCLDTSTLDGVRRAAGPFWAQITGCRFEVGDDPGDPGDVLGDNEGMGIAICPVSEAKTVKNRVHLDVSVSSIDDVVRLGGRPVTERERWTECVDVEGNEFCAFVRDTPLAGYRAFEFCVDSADPEAIARWWATAYGVEAHHDDGEPWWWIEDFAGAPGVPGFAMVFNPVPEPKTVKNRMHWDVYGDPAAFVDLGATVLWEVPGRTRPIAWTTLADPEGNEFCVFPPA